MADISVLKHQHPEVKSMQTAWERIRVLVEEDEPKYSDPVNCIKFPNESPEDYRTRQQIYSMGFFNPSQDLVSAAGEYICRQQIIRETPSDDLKAFWEKADKSGQSINDFVQNQISPNLTGYGTVFAVVDKPRGVSATKADERKNGMPYLCILHPLQVLDWQWGEDGELVWFRYWQAQASDRTDPFSPAPTGDLEYVVWTRTDYYRFDKDGKEVPDAKFTHGFGVVPIAIQSSFVVDTQKTLGKSTFFSGSRQIFMGNSHLSKANTEIVKYGSVLITSTMDFDPRQRERDIDPDTNLPKMQSPTAEGNILATGDMANPPSYLEKDITVVDKANLQAQMYFNWAAHAEATGQEAAPLAAPEAKPDAPQSGVAKAYDFRDVDANLHAKAQDLQAVEHQIARIVLAELKVKADFTIKYPQSFDVDSFEAKVAKVADLARINFGSDLGRKIAQKRITSDLTQDQKERDEINKEIDASKPPEPELKKPAPAA